MRGIFPACCASTEPQSAKSIAQRVRTAIFFFMSFAVSNVEPLLNDFISPIQQRLRNGHADLLGRLQIEHQLKLRRSAPQADRQA